MNPLKIDSLPHHWQVLAVLLLSAGLTAIAYGLSQAGLAELAASCLSFYSFFLGGRILAKLAVTRQAAHFRESQALLGTLYRESQVWLNDRKILALSIIGVPVTMVFVGFKTAIATGLAAFSNIWFAVGAGLLAAAFVSSPLLFRTVREAIFAEPSSQEAPAGDRTQSAAPARASQGWHPPQGGESTGEA